MKNNEKKAVLILENGTVTEGKSFGVAGSIIGEAVFSTAMTGYQETLTDPSYYGQILVQAFPLIGNYGVNDDDNESDKSAVSGFVVREWCDTPSNFRCTDNLDNFMKKRGIIGLYDIDTRKLVRELREHGVMNAMITTEEYDINNALEQIKNFKLVDAAKAVSLKKAEKHITDCAKHELVLLDFGCKHSFIENFLFHGCNVTAIPFNSDIDEIQKYNPDGVVLSPGPGNPNDFSENIAVIKNIIEFKLPLFGAGLGHQLIALAAGGKINKLKQGHRGGNQPVIDTKSGKTYITAQNHGYTVDASGIKAEINRVNANDKSCEGLIYKEFPAMSVEFYPQTLGIINDTSYIFTEFISLIENNKK